MPIVSKSTIVEIIEAYQPCKEIGICMINLQQQKLLKHTSLNSLCLTLMLSTIVEIIEAYQPKGIVITSFLHLQQQKLLKHTSQYVRQRRSSGNLQQQKLLKHTSPMYRGINSYSLSTIVEIIEAYQPARQNRQSSKNLQQQKLLKHTSLSSDRTIYGESTIVEIIEAYQPSLAYSVYHFIYNSRTY